MRSLMVGTRLYKDTSLSGPMLYTPARKSLLTIIMSGIEFVIEVPQYARQNKKRPRLVTSCDHCRVKKIKCVQHPTAGKCEACAAAHLPCLFRDREQYFAERTRMLSGATSVVCEASTSGDPSAAQLSAINSSSSYSTPDRGFPAAAPPNTSHPSAHYPFMDMNGVDLDRSQAFSGGMGAQAVLPLSWHDPPQASTWAQQSHVSHLGSRIPTPATPPLFCSPESSPSTSGLFDLSDPTQPHPNLMMDFVPVFFDKFGAAYPFLTPENVCDQFFRRRLSPLLANSIAASAARFSTVPEIQQIGPANAANVYCQMAKNLMPQNSSGVPLDAVHALIILAWAEYKRGRHVVFITYARTAIRIAAELGISDDSMSSPLAHILDPEVARVIQATLQSIGHLNRTISTSPFVTPSPNTPASTSSSCMPWGHPAALC